MHFGMPSLGLLLMIFGLFGVVVLRRVYFWLILKLEVLLLLAALPFLGRGLLRIRSRRLGGRAAGGTVSGRLYRVSQGDDVGVHCAQYFVHSSLSPVLLFRQRLKSVADVLKGLRSKWFTQSRWDALLRYWGAVCRRGPCGPISSLRPWDVFRISMAFSSGCLISLEVLNGFLGQVVVSRRDDGIRKWTWWLRKDLSSRPHVWLRPDFLPLSSFSSCQWILRLSLLRSWLNFIFFDAEFRKAWMPFFCGSGHPVVTPAQFLDFVGHLLPQEPFLDLPRITGGDLQEVAGAKKSTAGGLDGWAWYEIKASPLPWFSGLAILLELVETSGVRPQGLLDAYIAMLFLRWMVILLRQVNGLSACSRLCTGCGLPFGLDICGSGLRGVVA